jgi:hypothetical protein
MSTPQEYWDACLIKTWRNDGKIVDAYAMFKSITGETVFNREPPLLRTPKENVPTKIRVRVYVAQHLEKISKRLWEQKPDKDVLLLKKLQTSKYDTTEQKTQLDRELTNTQNQHKADKKRVAMNVLQYSVRNQKTDWRVTK